MKPIRIIGIGNTFAGDDAIGPLITRRLEGHQVSFVEIIEAGLSGLNLLSLMDGAEVVLLIDAILSGHSPGTIHRLEIPQELNTLRTYAWSSNSSSTHSFGLAESLILSNTLATLPSTVIVFGIELQQTTLGEPCSSAINQAIEMLTQYVQEEIDKAVFNLAGRVVPAK
jgi:hydrogenase maturation protease